MPLTTEEVKVRAIAKAIASEWGYCVWREIDEAKQKIFTVAAVAALTILTKYGE